MAEQTDNLQLQLGGPFATTPSGKSFDWATDVNFKKIDDEIGSLKTALPGVSSDKANGISVQGEIKAKSFRGPSNKPTPLVSFVFDDGLAGAYSSIKPVFDSKAAVFTVAVPTSSIGINDNTYLNWVQLATLQASGCEIINHTATHPSDLTVLTEAQIRNEFTVSQAAFTAHGINVTSVVYPAHKQNAMVRRVARDYFRSARGRTDIPQDVNGLVLDTYQLNSIDIDDPAQLPLFKRFVDYAKANNRWIIFYGHLSAAANIALLGALIDYIQENNVSIVTFSTALDAIENQQDIGDAGQSFSGQRIPYVESPMGVGTPASTAQALATKAIGYPSQLFYGTGLNDCVFGGTYTGGLDAPWVIVTIDGVSSPNTFSWSFSGLGTFAGVPITGEEQHLAYGITVKFSATTGHTLADHWNYNLTVAHPFVAYDLNGNKVMRVANDGSIQVPLDPTTVIWDEDFPCQTNSSGPWGSLGWTAHNIGAAAVVGSDASGITRSGAAKLLGVLQVSTGTASGNGSTIALDTVYGSTDYLFNTAPVFSFDSYFIFTLWTGDSVVPIANTQFRIGYITPNNTAAAPTHHVGLRYDTALGDSTFKFCNDANVLDTGIAPDGVSVYRIRIRSIVAGAKWGMTLYKNGQPVYGEKTIGASNCDINAMPFVGPFAPGGVIVTLSSSSVRSGFDFDAFKFVATGLSR